MYDTISRNSWTWIFCLFVSKIRAVKVTVALVVAEGLHCWCFVLV